MRQMVSKQKRQAVVQPIERAIPIATPVLRTEREGRGTTTIDRAASPSNALTVDVEDYFHASAFSEIVPRESWDRQPSRVEQSTRKVLELLAEFDLHATFFILGWVAERYPCLVREIQAAGHDLGCHSYAHQLTYRLSPNEFRDDTRRALAAIEDAAGAAVHAYRAPTFSITNRSLWALGILLELGFTIDSSIFPTRNHLYGIPNTPRQPFRIRIQGSDLMEFPLPALKLAGWGMPVTGGTYLRLLPYGLQLLGLKRIARRGQPAVLYFHPWELDPDQPRLGGTPPASFCHYAGLDRTKLRLRQLFKIFPFGKLAEALPPMTPVYEVDAIGGSTSTGAVFTPLALP
jgi:polysaccharide deacetylase family protein (PEP-CTERM system associated)